MKKSIVFFTLLMSLSSCSWIKKQSIEADNPQTPKAAANEQVNADSVLYTQAILLKSIETCAKISSEETRQNCEATVITKNALAALDKEMCNQITIEAYKSKCLEKVTYEIDTDPKDSLD